MSGFDDGWRRGELAGFVVLALLLLALWQVPMLGWLVYPFRLFGTFVHELSHGLAALATGGSFARFVVQPDLSGMAWSSGGTRWVVASAGYLGSATFGALLTVLASRGVPARPLLFVLGLALALLCVLFVRNLFGVLTGLGLAAALMLAALYLRRLLVEGLLLVLALQSLLDGFNSLWTVLHLSTAHGVHTDAHTMAALSGLPAPVWVVAWMLCSVLALLLALRLAYAGTPDTASPDRLQDVSHGGAGV